MQIAKDGIESEVIDPRTLVPFDKETLLSSVRKTGRLVIVHEDNLRHLIANLCVPFICGFFILGDLILQGDESLGFYTLHVFR